MLRSIWRNPRQRNRHRARRRGRMRSSRSPTRPCRRRVRRWRNRPRPSPSAKPATAHAGSTAQPSRQRMLALEKLIDSLVADSTSASGTARSDPIMTEGPMPEANAVLAVSRSEEVAPTRGREAGAVQEKREAAASQAPPSTAQAPALGPVSKSMPTALAAAPPSLPWPDRPSRPWSIPASSSSTRTFKPERTGAESRGQ